MRAEREWRKDGSGIGDDLRSTICYPSELRPEARSHDPLSAILYLRSSICGHLRLEAATTGARRDSLIGRLDALGDVAVAVIDLVDLLEALEGLGLVAHFVVKDALFVEDFLLGVVHGVVVGEGV